MQLKLGGLDTDSLTFSVKDQNGDVPCHVLVEGELVAPPRVASSERGSVTNISYGPFKTAWSLDGLIMQTLHDGKQSGSACC